MAFRFLQRDRPADNLRNVKLSTYTPVLTFDGLLAGVDNVRHDVFISTKFTELARQCIFRLLVKYGNVGELVAQQQEKAFRPPSVVKPEPTRIRASDPAEFKRQLSDLLLGSLNRAKTENNICLDLMARVAVIQFLRTEMIAQFSTLLERCRVNLKSYERPATFNADKAMRVRESFLQLQVGKKNVLRKVGQDLLQTCREVEKETLARLRRSLFGDISADYDLFLNRLIFTEDGQDDGIKAEHYVLLGNFSKDPDRYEAMLEICRRFLVSLGTSADPPILDAVLSAPDNAQELVAIDDDAPQSLKAVLAKWVKFLEDAQVMRHVLAAYEVVPLLNQFSPPVN